MEKNFFAVLISTLGRFDRANKKESVIYTLRIVAITLSGIIFQQISTFHCKCRLNRLLVTFVYACQAQWCVKCALTNQRIDRFTL